MRIRAWRQPPLLLVAASAGAQSVTKGTVEGVTNFVKKVESTIACGGAHDAGRRREIKLGYKSVISLRMATEAGADVEAEAAGWQRPLA